MNAIQTIDSTATPWTEFAASSTYRNLTEKQKRWIVAFLSCDDAVLATRLAYECKSVRNATIMSWEIRSVPAIQKALRTYHGKPSDQVFLEGLQDTIDRAKPGSYVRADAQKLYAQVVYKIGTRDKSDKSEEPEVAPAAPAPRFKVGDICLQNGLKFRVTSIDANGKPLTADKVE